MPTATAEPVFAIRQGAVRDAAPPPLPPTPPPDVTMAAPPAQSDATSAEAAEWDAYVTKVLASAHEQPTRPGVAVAEFAAEADCERARFLNPGIF